MSNKKYTSKNSKNLKKKKKEINHNNECDKLSVTSTSYNLNEIDKSEKEFSINECKIEENITINEGKLEENMNYELTNDSIISNEKMNKFIKIEKIHNNNLVDHDKEKYYKSTNYMNISSDDLKNNKIEDEKKNFNLKNNNNNNNNNNRKFSNLKNKNNEITASDKLGKLKDILYDQLKKKNMTLDEKLRNKKNEKSKLEEVVKREGLELFRINKEIEDLEKKEQEVIESLQRIHCKKNIYLNENIELKKSYDNELMNLKKELSYYAEIYNKYNNSLLERNNLKKYYEFINANSKIRENMLSSDRQMKLKENKINKKENVISKLNHQINEIKNNNDIKKNLCKNEETEGKNLEKLISDGKKELLLLKNEKKSIVKKLNESINQMKKRDEAIDEINSKLNELKLNINDLEKNNEKLHREFVLEKEKKENFNMEFNILKNDLKKLKKKKEDIEKDIDEISTYNNKMRIELNKEKKNSEVICDEIKNINKDIMNKESSIKIIKNDISRNIDKIINVYTEEIKVNHFASKIKNEVSSIKENISKKENEIENYKNAIVRIKIQQILENTKIENMQKKMGKLENEFNEKNNILSNYENTIKKNHYIIENKQVEVDRLNEEFDKKNKKSDDFGKPVTSEIKIQKLNKQISYILKESRFLEKQWFLKQSNMVKIQNDNVKINDEIIKNKDLCVILDQKKCELQENLKNVHNIIKKLNKNILYIRLQLEKFASKNNETLDKIKKLEDDILKWNENLNIKAEGDKKKKENLQIEIDELKKEKMQYQQDLLDYENKILIFENKIIEERKLQEIIKEYIGNKDIIQLKKQIQQKNTIIENMKKQQNTILSSIQFALNKRNDLDNKKEIFQKNYESGVNVSFKIYHEISLIKKNFKVTKNKRKQLNNHLIEIIEIHNNLLKQEEDQKLNLKHLNEEYYAFEGILKIQNYQKKHRFQELLKFQKAMKNMNSFENLKIPYVQIKEKCSTYKKKLLIIKNKLESFNTENENYIKCISVILEWIIN
ncbi:conserved Plasmodium protein, unknown function [Plasmodium gallinaceum]|uniref:Uncharacterized protein n=1 Tax=Plasmodium gallinaceum TaxID=5849 RepID=A0A1J1GV80_PLAGA|nr:conserved Plasmodium protein, unknown function [Plasmodium gallinaceum]CRG96134.1 conserved Plasmodium protein, unknown function [Plasmodium gallinaceum]